MSHKLKLLKRFEITFSYTSVMGQKMIEKVNIIDKDLQDAEKFIRDTYLKQNIVISKFEGSISNVGEYLVNPQSLFEKIENSEDVPNKDLSKIKTHIESKIKSINLNSELNDDKLSEYGSGAVSAYDEILTLLKELEK